MNHISPGSDSQSSTQGDWRLVSEFSLAGRPSDDLLAANMVREALRAIGIHPEQIKRLEEAIATAVLEILEEGSSAQEELPIKISVKVDKQNSALTTDRSERVDDMRHRQANPPTTNPTDLAIHYNWGYFLIKKNTAPAAIQSYPSIELFLYREPGSGG